MAATVTVYASRSEVNVILPGTGYRGEGNNRFDRPKGSVNTWIKALIARVIDEDASIGWKRNGYSMSAPVSHKRGEYKVTVWIPKHTIPMRVLSSGGHNSNHWLVCRADGLRFDLTWNHNDTGRILVRTLDRREDDNADWVDYTYAVVPEVENKPLTQSVWRAMEIADQWIDVYGPLFI